MKYYTHFKIYWPQGVMKFIPDEPRTDLLSGVCDCGIIPADVAIEYFENDQPLPAHPLEQYGSSYKLVPDEIRKQAQAQWNTVLESETENAG